MGHSAPPRNLLELHRKLLAARAASPAPVRRLAPDAPALQVLKAPPPLPDRYRGEDIPTQVPSPTQLCNFLEPIENNSTNKGSLMARLRIVRGDAPDVDDDLTSNDGVQRSYGLSSASSDSLTPRANAGRRRSLEKIALRRPPGIRQLDAARTDVEVSEEVEGSGSPEAPTGLPQPASCQRAPLNDQRGKTVTTLTIDNLTTAVTPEVFMQNLNEIGLSGTYDYLYMPQVQESQLSRSAKRFDSSNRSYVFVNFKEKMEPSELQAALLRSTLPNKDRLVVTPAKHQGVFQNLEEIHNSGIQNSSSSIFDKVWVTIGQEKILKCMDAPTAYLIYRINQTA